MVKRVLQEIQSRILCNNIILGYPELKCEKDKVNLHCFYPEYTSQAEDNLGDYLSKVVVEWMLEQKSLTLSTKISEGVRKHLYAIGSIMLMGYQNATVWGTGFPFSPSYLRAIFNSKYFRKLDIRAVRGPLSRKILVDLGFDCSSVYGDPAVRMPLIYTPHDIEVQLDYLVIPDFSMENTIRKIIPEDHIISMKTKDYKKVINKICSAKVVVSSSLHGIILAEAYGIPAVFVQDRPEKFNFKYQDWYESTNRTMEVYTNLEKALTVEKKEVPDLNQMRKNLIDSFPYDLWN